jgi:CDP-diacylglycerol--serine O-phosphatidyltransferase
MKIRRGGFLPNLCTLGNGVCGFAALVKTFKAGNIVPGGGLEGGLAVNNFQYPELFATAAWLILLGMVFDVFDGKLARLSGKTSDLGAQLDSLCDLTTFGIAPAVLVIRLNMVYDDLWGRFVWFFALAYFLGALLRLARFNAENDHDESAHLCFKGLPSPAAAGCVASLVIFHRYIVAFREPELLWLRKLALEQDIQNFDVMVQGIVQWIPKALPLLLLFLGYTMVSSRLKYEHVASRIFNRGQSFEFLVYMIFGTVLAALLPELVLPLVFVGYLVHTPVVVMLRALRHWKHRPGAVEHLPPRPVP